MCNLQKEIKKTKHKIKKHISCLKTSPLKKYLPHRKYTAEYKKVMKKDADKNYYRFLSIFSCIACSIEIPKSFLLLDKPPSPMEYA